MTKSHYGSSFIISSLLYTALGFSLLSLLETPKNFTKKSPEQVIKIAVIRPKPKVIVPPIVVPTPPVVIPPKKIIKPKPKPKPKPKKIVKKHKPKVKHKPKHKKIIKKIVKKTKPKPKKIIKKVKPIEKDYFTPAPIRAVEQPIEKDYFTPAPTRAVEQPQIPTVTQAVTAEKVDKSAEKKAFLNNVRRQIKSNKKYPKIALRRHIEGSVGVMFDIQSNGQVSNIRFLNGKSILQKSVRQAVIRSFPINIPNNVRSELPIYNISVTVHFKIN